MRRFSNLVTMPLPAVLVLMLCFGVMAPLFWVSASEDGALSETTTARVFPGGETGTVGSARRGGGSGETLCRDAPVKFEVDGQTYSETTTVRGIECPTGGSVETEIRYDPDDPTVYSTMVDQQIWLQVLAAMTALGCLLWVGVLVLKIVSRLRGGRR